MRNTRRTQGVKELRIATGFGLEPLPDGNSVSSSRQELQQPGR
jgi:hypothetical protein